MILQALMAAIWEDPLDHLLNTLRKCSTKKKTEQSEVMRAAKRLKVIYEAQPDVVKDITAYVMRECPKFVEKVPDFAKSLDALVHIPLNKFSHPKEVLTFTEALIESGMATQVDRGLVFVLGNTSIGKTSLVNTFKSFVENPMNDRPSSVLTKQGDSLIETQVLEVYEGLSLKQKKIFNIKTTCTTPVFVNLEESPQSALEESIGLQLRIVDMGKGGGRKKISCVFFCKA